nr:MAG TPA: hypothetical protein [Bacteriophage sp.]
MRDRIAAHRILRCRRMAVLSNPWPRYAVRLRNEGQNN